jgi:hypothetical protein
MTHQPSLSDNLIHAGAGTALLTVQLSALIPGLLRSLALLGVIALVFVLPVIVLGLAERTGPPFAELTIHHSSGRGRDARAGTCCALRPSGIRGPGPLTQPGTTSTATPGSG